MLGLAGTAAGALLATGVAVGVNALRIGVPEAMQIFIAQERLTLLLEPGWIVAKVALLSSITVLASWLPARRAARLRPVTAMYHVG